MEEERAPGPTAAQRTLRFSLVGATGVVVNLGILHALVRQAGLHYALASAVAIEASLLSNFLGHRFWTWRDRPGGWRSLAAFHAVAVVGIALQWVTLVAGVEVLRLHYLAAAALGIGIAAAWNFLGHHLVSFAAGPAPARARAARPFLYVAALVLYLGVGAALTQDWDTWVFQTSAHAFLTDGTTPYRTAESSPSYIWSSSQVPGTPMWYAYPPVPLLLMAAAYWPAAYGLVPGPLAARLLIKLPFIVGALALGWTARRFLASAEPGGAPRAPRAERLLLFSPLLLVVTAVWGMFEALLLLLLLACLSALRRERIGLAGAAWGAAALLKIFPLYLAPVLAVYVARRSGRRAAATFFAAGLALFGAVSLPFLLSTPAGYLQQVFLMHGARPPGEFGLFAAVYNVLTFLNEDLLVHPLVPRSGLLAALGLLSFGLTGLALLLCALGSARAPATERNLLFFLAASLLWGLFFTKTISAHYLALPLALFVLYWAHPGPAGPLPAARLGRLLRALNLAAPAAALIANGRLLIFVPPDLALPLFGADVSTVGDRIAASLGTTPWMMGILLMGLAQALIGVVFWAGLPTLAPTLEAGLRALEARLPRPPGLPRLARVGTRALSALAIGLVLTPSLAYGAYVATQQAAPPPVEPALDRLAGIVYEARWRNPAHDPTLAYAGWEYATVVPLRGFHWLNSHQVREDVRSLRTVGFDYLLVPYDPNQLPQLRSLGLLAREEGLAYAFLFDLAQLLRDANNDTRGLEPGTGRYLADLLDRPLLGYWESPALLRLGPDERLPVFLAGVDAIAPQFTAAELRHVARLRWATTAPGEAWDRDAEETSLADAPTSVDELADHPDPSWRAAYAEARRLLWLDLLSFLDDERPYLLLLDDEAPVEFRASVPARADVAWGPLFESPRRVAARLARGATDAEAAPAPADAEGAIRSIVPAFDETLRTPASRTHAAIVDGRLWLDDQWAEATADSTARHVLVHAWNAYDRGAAIEPTLEFGDVLAQRTGLWLAAYHGGAAPVPPWDPLADPIPPRPDDLRTLGYPVADILERVLEVGAGPSQA